MPRPYKAGEKRKSRRFAMNSFRRPKTLTEVVPNILAGADPGMEVKDFLHEFKDRGDIDMLQQPPRLLAGNVSRGEMLDAYFQALAVYLAAKLNLDPPEWTQPAKHLSQPWFASTGKALRNYLLISSPAPFRARNLFIDEDSLRVV
jgi:hypothetical protein